MLLHECYRSKLRSSYLHSKPFPDWTLSLSPRYSNSKCMVQRHEVHLHVCNCHHGLSSAGPACMVTLTRHSYGSFVVHQSSTPPSGWATVCLPSPPTRNILAAFKLCQSEESHFKHLRGLSHGHEFLSHWRMCNARPLAWCHQHHWVENSQAQHTMEVVFA